MHIELRVAAAAARCWHVELARLLDEVPGTTVVVRVGPSPDDEHITSSGGRHAALLRTERWVHRVAPRLAAPAAAADFAAWTAHHQVPHLVLDLEGATGRNGSWQLTFDGRPGTDAALAALVDGRFPIVRICEAGRVVAAGRPGSELLRPVTAALDDVLAGTMVLIRQAVAGRPLMLQECGPAIPAGAGSDRPADRSAAAVIARTVVSAGVRRAYRAAYRAPHWRVGWRMLPTDSSPDLLDALDHPPEGWSVLPDDGYHFYADPFPVIADGRHFLFVEDFDHRRGRGVVAVVEMDGRGPSGAPQPVLDHTVHLSYPFVLADDGEWWMIPETSAAGTVELYRAVRFPYRWRLETVLLRDVEASDVSVVRHQERWWMFATVRHGGAWSDALHLWSADALTGPWLPHPGNPVLLDIASARPAGRIVRRDGRLLRPVQDGSTGYGGALGIAEVTRLDGEGYEQRVVGRLAAGERWPGRRLHTLNRAGRLECIDGSARSPRFWR